MRKSVELAIDVADAAAFLQVESRGQGFSPQTGRMIIRFENHVFYDRWGQNHPEQFQQHFQFNTQKPRTRGHQFRSDPKAPFAKVHTNQHREWEVFEFARALNEAAAIQSISMGAAQILGSNYATVGYSSPREMFDEMSRSMTGQVKALFSFIAKARGGAIVKALQEGDYIRAALIFNGKGQQEEYGAKLREASAAYKRVVSQSTDL